MDENQVDDSLLNVGETKTEESAETTAVDNNLDVDVTEVKNVNIEEFVAEEASECAEKASVDFNESVEACGLEKESHKIIIHSNVRLDVLNDHVNNDESADKSSHKKKKRLKIFDSDSEEDNAVPETTEEKNPTSGDEIEKEHHKPVSSNVFFCVLITVLMFFSYSRNVCCYLIRILKMRVKLMRKQHKKILKIVLPVLKIKYR